MLPEIITLQNDAVSNLVDLINAGEKKQYTFRAPTGSGKTYMMADFMNRMLGEWDDVIFLVSSLSKSDLAAQNYEKIAGYRRNNGFNKVNPYLISSEISDEERLFIPTTYNIYLLPRDLYRDGSRLMQGSFVNFLTEMIMRFNKRIVWIKDECHISTTNLDKIAETYFDYTINFSATPKLSRGQHPDVEITDLEAERCGLIKSIVWGDEDDTFETAINKFKEIKADYIDKLGVNPCLIVQISNKEKADEELNNVIMPVLQNNPELKWMTIVTDSKNCDTNDALKAKGLPVSKWKDYAKNDLSTIDVIIFKMVISEGWDIPRACMLYQARNSRSQQLDEQVVGRIRRNPCLLNYESLSEDAKKLALTAWAWGVSSKEKSKIFAVRLQDDQSDIANSIKIKTTHLKPLSEKKTFNIKTFVESKDSPVISKSIFELNKSIKRTDYDVQRMIYDYIGQDISKWFKTAECAAEIAKENNQYMCDYSSSMDIAGEQTFSNDSYYVGTDKYVNISNWVWRRKDGAERFSFDSEAERDWADILKDISNTVAKVTKTGKKNKNPNAGVMDIFGEIQQDVYESTTDVNIWGKNFIPNSNIRFEYYLDGIHNSHPDFVLVDKFGRVHLFEVKSLNKSSSLAIEGEDYKKKIQELKRCYRAASLITGQCFYLPVLKGEIWHVISYICGEEHIYSLDEFKKFISTQAIEDKD